MMLWRSIAAFLLFVIAFAVCFVSIPRSSSAQEHNAESSFSSAIEEMQDEAQEASEEAGGILDFQPTLAFYTLIDFIIVLLLLWRFAWGPMVKALNDREERLQSTFEEAERARSEAAALLEQHRKQMEQVQIEVRQILDDAHRRSQAVYDERVQQAKDDADATINRAHREINSAKEQALNSIYDRSADLAVMIAGRVLERELGNEDQNRLVAAAAQELRSAGQPNGSGGHA